MICLREQKRLFSLQWDGLKLEREALQSRIQHTLAWEEARFGHLPPTCKLMFQMRSATVYHYRNHLSLMMDQMQQILRISNFDCRCNDCAAQVRPFHPAECNSYCSTHIKSSLTRRVRVLQPDQRIAKRVSTTDGYERAMDCAGGENGPAAKHRRMALNEAIDGIFQYLMPSPAEHSRERLRSGVAGSAMTD